MRWLPGRSGWQLGYTSYWRLETDRLVSTVLTTITSCCQHCYSRLSAVLTTVTNDCLLNTVTKEYHEVKPTGAIQCSAWHRSPPSKRVILKNDLLLVFQKRRLCLDTKSKCQYDNEGPPSKNRHIEDDLILVLKNQTYTVKVITVRLKFAQLPPKKGFTWVSMVFEYLTVSTK
jgi:hypothetical protein